jgi:hypothetical protein
MKFFATSFSLVLGAWRLRFSIDIDEDPEVKTLAMRHVLHREREKTFR